jgi:selenoprotein W-related protein
LPRAARLADEIKDNYGIEPELVRLSGGVYEIYIDNKLIYSKKETGAFPENKDILNKIKEAIN